MTTREEFQANLEKTYPGRWELQAVELAAFDERETKQAERAHDPSQLPDDDPRKMLPPANEALPELGLAPEPQPSIFDQFMSRARGEGQNAAGGVVTGPADGGVV